MKTSVIIDGHWNAVAKPETNNKDLSALAGIWNSSVKVIINNPMKYTYASFWMNAIEPEKDCDD